MNRARLVELLYCFPILDVANNGVYGVRGNDANAPSASQENQSGTFTGHFFHYEPREDCIHSPGYQFRDLGEAPPVAVEAWHGNVFG